MALRTAPFASTGFFRLIADLARTDAEAPLSGRENFRAPWARLEIVTDFAAARGDWLKLEALVTASPYQSYAFCRAWRQTFQARAQPLIVVARDEAGEAAALMPLALRRLGPWRVAEFIGGRMANYQMGLFREPELWSRRDTAALIDEILRAARLDWLQFANQPLAWRGRPNPLAALGGRESPSFAYYTSLADDYEAWSRAHFSASARKKRRAKTRRLMSLGPIVHERAETPEARRAALDAFFAQKRARMGGQNLPNEYDEPENVALIERLADAEQALELHALKVGERIVSVFGGLCAHDRLSGLIVSHDPAADVAHSSPGELIIAEIARDAIRRNLAEFDLGVGDARYKSECCEVVEPLIDASFAATFSGRVAAALFLQMRALKRRVKRSPRLFELARLAQRWGFMPRVR